MPTIYEALLGNVTKGNATFKPLTTEETDNDYIARLTQAVSGTTKEDFEAMPAEAQSWFDQAADALNEGKPVPLPEGYDRQALLNSAAQHTEAPPATVGRPGLSRPAAAAAPAAVTPAPVVAEAATTPASADAGEAPAEATEEPTAEGVEEQATPAAPRSRSRRPARQRSTSSANRGTAVLDGMGITTLIRRMVIEKYPAQDITVTQLLEELKQKGADLSERRSTVSTLRYDTISHLKLALELGWQPPASQQQG